ncbi:MAG: translation initiation factor IF-2 subunit alpha, partial [Candidatus Thermoplasmatota archaeon]|nr:translation initiation factor IF-2 subunit alpha [Candidatus Thermoplasmatota archaeon]
MPQSPEYPEEGELVVCTVKDVKNFGAFVSLDEYGSREGFIHVSEIATGCLMPESDHVKEGQKIVCKVTEVDRSKGHVNLSLKQVNDHQRREKIQQWKNENKARKLLDIFAEKIGQRPDEFYEKVGLPLIDRFGSLYAAFEAAATDKNAIRKAGIPENYINDFNQIAAENIASPSVTIDGLLELSSQKPEGIDDIKKALSEAISRSDEHEVRVQYIGAPR